MKSDFNSLSTQGDRLKTFRKSQGMTQEELSAYLKVTASAVSQMEKNKTDITSNALGKLRNAFNINANWLLYGLGPVLQPPSSPEEDSTPDAQKGNVIRSASIKLLRDTLRPSPLHNVVYVSQRVQADYTGAENIDDYAKQLPASYIPSMEGKEARGFQIKGDSMNYAIHDGDWVLCERLENVWHVHDGAVYVLVTDKDIICKRVVNKVRESGKITLRSDNDYYGEQYVYVKDIKEVWVVEAKISRDFNQVKAAIDNKNEKIKSLRQSLTSNNDLLQRTNETLRGKDEVISAQQGQIDAMKKTLSSMEDTIRLLKKKAKD